MDMVGNINYYLEKFDLVLVFIDGRGAAKALTEQFLRSEALRNTSKKILVLSDQKLLYTSICHEYRQLPVEELEFLRKMYFLYDFSDHFQIVSDSPQYGGLLNYVKTGEMTMENVFQAIVES